MREVFLAGAGFSVVASKARGSHSGELQLRCDSARDTTTDPLALANDHEVVAMAVTLVSG